MARHVTPADIAAALARRTQRDISDFANAFGPYRALTLGGRAPQGLLVTPRPLRRGDKARGAAMLAGRFALAGETLAVPVGDSPWDLTAPSRRFAEALHV